MSTVNDSATDTSDKEGSTTVLVVPDVFASGLRTEGGTVWVAAEAIAAGRLGEIRYRGDATEHGAVVDGLIDRRVLEALESAFGTRARMVPVPYDWRGGIDAGARALRAAVDTQRAEEPTAPIAVVGHGLGALAAMACVADHADWPAKLGGGRIVLVAPPLDGAEAILQLAAGKGRLFGMLTRLDHKRSATDVLRLFLAMPGIADLLPARALARDWWDDLALTAPAEALLEDAAGRRDRLRKAGTMPAASALLGAAAETVAYDANDDDDLVVERHGDGDGFLRNPTSGLPAATFFVAAVHERLVADRGAVQAIVDLALTGTTTLAATAAPTDNLPEQADTAVALPEQADLLAELTAADAATYSGKPSTLRVKVVHGSLDRLGLPVAVGHYTGDALFGAEKFLDRCLEGRLEERRRLGDYPGPVGTALAVAAPHHKPPGALVIGLGEVGELSSGRLALGVEKAVLQYALQALDRRRDEGRNDEPAEALALASLLIGTRGGRQLSVRQAIVATVRGVLAAKRLLAREGLDRQVQIEKLSFVELWADIATAACHAIMGLNDDPSLGRLPNETIVPQAILQIAEGGRGIRPYSNESWFWWRRLIVTEPTLAGDDRTDSPPGLRFLSLSERARAEDRLVSAHRALVDELLERAPRSISEVAEGSVVNALFELLLPVSLKEAVFDGGELVLVVDRAASRYPWELLARRKGGTIEPLVTRVKVVRQLRTGDFRESILPARSDQALVIAEPEVSFLPPLASAAEEGRQVAQALSGDRFHVERSIGEIGDKIVQKLFLADYRVMHIAGHGVYDAEKPDESGVVIGADRDRRPRVLSAAVFRQLRAVPELVFLNCCHLGRIDQEAAIDRGTTDYPRLAASLAEALIGLGVKCVVTAGWAISDKAGLLFAQTFYRQLLDGRPFGEAVHDARNAVWRRFQQTTTTWGAYQCYGDPAFRLRKPKGGGGGRRRDYVSQTEVQAAIGDLVAKAASTGDSAEELSEVRERLRAIEEALAQHATWREGGDLLFLLAEAWKQAAEPERAIELYRAALLAWDGLAPLKAAEQLANLLDRYGRGQLAGQLTQLEVSSTRRRRPLPQAWIEWADQIGGSPERAAILGASYKRRALGLTAARRRKVLARSAAAYARAVDMIKAKRKGEIPYYQGLNAVAIAWAAEDEELLGQARTWLAGSRTSAQAEQERRGETLWNRLAACEADLLEALLDGRLSEKRATALQVAYRRVLATIGSVHDRDSARKQVDFLVQCAPRDQPQLVKALEIIQKAFADVPKEDSP